MGAPTGAFSFCLGCGKLVENFQLVGRHTIGNFSYICTMNTHTRALQKASNGKAHAPREAAKHLVRLGYLVIQTGKDGDPKQPLKEKRTSEIRRCTGAKEKPLPTRKGSTNTQKTTAI